MGTELAARRQGNGKSSPQSQPGPHNMSGHSGAGNILGGVLQVWGEHHGPRKGWGVWNLGSGLCPVHGDQEETQAAAI